jgi:SAM-dependent methyltransferase
LNLVGEGCGLGCRSCRRGFGCEQGIPLLFWPNEWPESKTDVTERVKSFYEENPFPSYEGMDSTWSLREKAEKGIFARLLDDQIPHGALILEAGCGTGQLSNFLGMRWGRGVFGTDICLNSLRLAQGFKVENGIRNVAFLQMNLFRPVFRPRSFDLVICNGVLHHTSDPFEGFRSIGELVRPGGFVIVGLYNAYGRIPTDVRRGIFQLSGERLWFLDARLRDRRLSGARRRIWFMDQYRNPHESKHTFGELLSWFDQTRFEFVNSIPKSSLLEAFSPGEKLFEPSLHGTPIEHILVQLGMLLSGGKEGGFFIMIGRRKA